MKKWQFVVLFVLTITSMLIMDPGLYHYDKMNDVPIRINRITGTIQIPDIENGGWRAIRKSKNVGAAKPVVESAKNMPRLDSTLLEIAFADYWRKHQLQNNGEYENYVEKEILFGDLNEDGLKDAVVAYFAVFKGGNLFYEYIIAFMNDGKKFVPKSKTKIGSRGVEVFDLMSLDETTVTMNHKFKIEGDADCCLSGSDLAWFVYSVRADKFEPIQN